MSLLDEAKAARDAAHKEQGLLLDAAAMEKRSLTDAEEAKFQAANTRKAALDERVSQLEREEKQEAAAANVRKMVGGGFTAESRGGTYHPQGEHSFFKDLVTARNGDFEAINRLHTNNAEQRTSAGLGSYTSGHGADFAPPGYLNVVGQARAGAVFANLVYQREEHEAKGQLQVVWCRQLLGAGFKHTLQFGVASGPDELTVTGASLHAEYSTYHISSNAVIKHVVRRADSEDFMIDENNFHLLNITGPDARRAIRLLSHDELLWEMPLRWPPKGHSVQFTWRIETAGQNRVQSSPYQIGGSFTVSLFRYGTSHPVGYIRNPEDLSLLSEEVRAWIASHTQPEWVWRYRPHAS